jgi:hypothetical protein
VSGRVRVGGGTARARQARLAQGLLAAAASLVGFSAGAAPLRAQAAAQGPPTARLVAFTNEPREPELGEIFALNLQVRLAPGVVAFFPDTLVPAPDAASAGAGTWELGLAPGDSVDVRATYPVIGLDPGGVELPTLEVWIRPAEAGEQAGPRSLASLDAAGSGDTVDPATVPGLERVVIPIGGALIMPLREMTEAADAGLMPRPPADVLGGQWSLWLMGSVGLGVVALVLLGWLFLAGRRAAHAGGPVTRLSPRAEALSELDRIRGLGWHANGRVVQFYDATTGVLRRFADRTEDGCGTFLTSSELLGRLERSFGAERVAGLRDAVWSAERVKFGTHRPGPPAAEEDWSVVRGWIAELPEGGR